MTENQKNDGAPENRRSLSDPNRWVELHGDYLFRFAVVRVNNRETAENLVQDTLIAAFQARDKFSGHSAERTWLVGILKNKIMDHFRRYYREHAVIDDRVVLDAKPDDPFNFIGHWKQSQPSWAEDAAKATQKKEFWKTFEKCLTGLPERLAQAFSMHEVDQLSGKEVCETLKITPSNLWVMLYRARMKLKRCLEANWFNTDVKQVRP